MTAPANYGTTLNGNPSASSSPSPAPAPNFEQLFAEYTRRTGRKLTSEPASFEECLEAGSDKALLIRAHYRGMEGIIDESTRLHAEVRDLKKGMLAQAALNALSQGIVAWLAERSGREKALAGLPRVVRWFLKK